MRLLSLIALLAVSTPRFGFESASVDPGGENVHNFHHQGITDEALAALDEPDRWWDAAARCLRWHVDWVDSYLYDPRWWVQGVTEGGLDRWQASMIMHDHLAAVHFDDLTSTPQIEQAWARYLSGTMAGLVWAQHRKDVACAQNIVGISLHAIQDFYAHSSWVDDPSRRHRTWVEIAPADRGRMYLYTGSYEHPEHLGQRSHGRVAPDCSVLRQPPVAAALEIICHPLSPFSESSICQAYRRCQDAVPAEPAVLGVPVPSGLVYVDEPGIALDSTWQAEIGWHRRELADRTEVTPRQLFDGARELAVRHSAWWLHQLGAWMRESPAGAAFWHQVQTEDLFERRTQPFEDVNRMAVSFAGAGDYPPVGGDEGWFLRLSITTGDVLNGGTDALVHAYVDDRLIELNHLGSRAPIVENDDFSRGSAVAFTLGPFATRPVELALRVEGRDVGDVLADVVTLIKELAESLFGAIVKAIGGLFGVDANEVAGAQVAWRPDELPLVGAPRRWERRIDGGARGVFTVAGTITCTARSASEAPHEQLDTYQLAITELTCHEESSEWSDSDEPFVVAALVNAGESDPLRRVRAWRSSPLSDVDAGRTYPLQGQPLPPVTVRRAVGAILLPLSVWESDQESYRRRDEIRDAFARAAAEPTQSTADRLIENWGALTGAAWRVGNVEAFAYTRSAVGAQGGVVVEERVNAWIGKGQSRTIPLKPSPTIRTWNLPREAWPANAPGIPLPFQADADGAVDESWWSPKQQTWTIVPSSGASPTTILLAAGALPLPVDLDGDGVAAPAQWLRSEGRVVVPGPDGDRSISLFDGRTEELTAVSAGLGTLALHQSQVDRPAGFAVSAARVGLHALLSRRDPAQRAAEAAVLLEHANYGLYVSTPEAVESAVRGTDLYTELSVAEPDRWRPYLSDGLRIRTWAHWQAEDHPATLAAARSRVALWEDEGGSLDQRVQLADAVLFLAVFERHLEPATALATTDRAAALFGALVEQDARTYLGRLADTFAERAWALWSLERQSEAVAAASAAADHRRTLAALDAERRADLVDGLLAAAHFAYGVDLERALELTDEARRVGQELDDAVRVAGALRYRVLAQTAAGRSVAAATAAGELGDWWRAAAAADAELTLDAADGLVFAAQYSRAADPGATVQLAAVARELAAGAADRRRRLDLTVRAWEQTAWAQHELGDASAAVDAAAERLPITEGLAALDPGLTGQHAQALALHATFAQPVDPMLARRSAESALTVLRRLVGAGQTAYVDDVTRMEALLATL